MMNTYSLWLEFRPEFHAIGLRSQAFTEGGLPVPDVEAVAGDPWDIAQQNIYDHLGIGEVVYGAPFESLVGWNLDDAFHEIFEKHPENLVEYCLEHRSDKVVISIISRSCQEKYSTNPFDQLACVTKFLQAYYEQTEAAEDCKYYAEDSISVIEKIGFRDAETETTREFFSFTEDEDEKGHVILRMEIIPKYGKNSNNKYEYVYDPQFHNRFYPSNDEAIQWHKNNQGFPEIGTGLYYLRLGNAGAREDQGPIVFIISVVGKDGVETIAPWPISADFHTYDGTAIAGSDYLSRIETIGILPGKSSFFFGIDLIDDEILEIPEYFNVQILSSSEGASPWDFGATGDIFDNDSDPNPSEPPIPGEESGARSGGGGIWLALVNWSAIIQEWLGNLLAGGGQTAVVEELGQSGGGEELIVQPNLPASTQFACNTGSDLCTGINKLWVAGALTNNVIRATGPKKNNAKNFPPLPSDLSTLTLEDVIKLDQDIWQVFLDEVYADYPEPDISSFERFLRLFPFTFIVNIVEDEMLIFEQFQFLEENGLTKNQISDTYKKWFDKHYGKQQYDNFKSVWQRLRNEQNNRAAWDALFGGFPPAPGSTPAPQSAP